MKILFFSSGAYWLINHSKSKIQYIDTIDNYYPTYLHVIDHIFYCENGSSMVKALEYSIVNMLMCVEFN